MAEPRPRRNRIVVGLPYYAPVSPRWNMNWMEFEQALGRYERYGGLYTTCMSPVELAMNVIIDNIFKADKQRERPSEALGILTAQIARLRERGPDEDGDGELVRIADDIERELTVRLFDYILFIEADNIISKEVVEKVASLDPKTQKVVGFPYIGRTDQNLLPVPGAWDAEGNWNRLTYEQYKPMRDNPGFHEVGSVGMGCTAVHRSVFEGWEPALEYGAWFQGHWELHEGQRPMYTAHDVWFCHRVRQQGHKVWISTEIPVGHLGEYLFTEDTFINSHEHNLRMEVAAQEGREADRAKAKAEFLAASKVGT